MTLYSDGLPSSRRSASDFEEEEVYSAIRRMFDSTNGDSDGEISVDDVSVARPQ